MKRLLLFSLLFAPLYAGEWYTATSITAGAKYLNQLPSSFDARIEQYFIHSDAPALYYKMGYFHEQLYSWGDSVDTAEDVQVGIGLNLLTFGGLFLDAGASVAYRIAYIARENTTAKALYADAPIVPFGEVGVGYSFGRYTLRTDFVVGMLWAGKVNLVNISDTTSIIASHTYNQYHMNIGVAYWW